MIAFTSKFAQFNASTSCSQKHLTRGGLVVHACGMIATFRHVALTLVAVLCFTAAGHAQLETLPKPGDAVGFVSHAEAGRWIVFGPGGFTPVQPIVVNEGKAVVWSGKSGEYAVIYFPAGDLAQPLVATVTLGKVEPGPNPPPPPPGNVWGIIIEESTERDSKTAQLWFAVRKKWSNSKVLIIDKDEAGSLRSVIQEARDAVGNALPVLAIVSTDDDSLVRAVPCPTTVEAIAKELGQ